jgi:phospholipid/cholesterol/gamma-HCH transport system ATP-binding protein
VIEFKNVSKRFGSRRVLDAVNLKVAAGQIVFVIGRSGVGKSVLLRHVVGLEQADSGEILFEDENIARLPESDFLRIRRRCGMVFQNPALIDSLTVAENLRFGLESMRAPPSDLERRVAQKLRWVGIGERSLSLYPSQLSYGLQKRVAIARALSMDPVALLFDEPTTGLDPVATASLNVLIRTLQQEHALTSLVVSHDMASALAIADRICLLDEGKVLAEGTPKQMLHSEIALVRAFLEDVRET